MKNLLLSSIACLLAVAFSTNILAATFYVANNGNDNWSGTLAKANYGKTDGPLATLEAARDKIRRLKKNGPLPAGGVEVVLREGKYYLSKTFTLNKEDSGTVGAPIIYRAAKGEKVHLIGGRSITRFVPYKGSILKADLAAQGLKNADFRELYFNDKRQHLARWPNYDPINPYTGGWVYVEGKQEPLTYGGIMPGESKRTFKYKESDARDWKSPEDGAAVFIFSKYNYWNDIVPIEKLDRQERMITLAKDASYPIKPGNRYFVQNLSEELDTPGEWYLDRKTETLYFWPPSILEKDVDVYAPTLDTIVKIGPDASWITVRGLVIECCSGTAVKVERSSDCVIAGNTIRNTGLDGIRIHDGRHVGAVGNDIYQVGRTGIAVYGGDQKTLTTSEHYADNNYIHHVGRLQKSGMGIFLHGVGHHATHNLIHECPRMAIKVFGNNMVIEYNHIHHTSLETEDNSAIYTFGRDWLRSRGSRIAYNFIHDVVGLGRRDDKWVTPNFASGIYLDDTTVGVDVIGNIVICNSRAPMYLHNARGNHIENNIFAGGPNGQIEYLGWTESQSFWARNTTKYFDAYDSVINIPVWKKILSVDVSPREAVLPNGTIMANNVVRRNILLCMEPKSKPYKMKNVSLKHNSWDYNLAYTYDQPVVVESNLPKNLKDRDAPVGSWPQWWQSLGQDRHSIVADPMFVDPDKNDFRLRTKSPAKKLGFKPIPIEKIGPYKNPSRASWPIVEAEGIRQFAEE